MGAMRAATEAPATIRVWHFAAHELRDGRPLPAKGDMLRHEGEVIACRAGLHGSPRAMDAIHTLRAHSSPYASLAERS
jgi:hypothetical protein